MTLSIEEIGAAGDGVAFVDGAPVYVPKSLVGETVLAEVAGNQGRLIEVAKSSPERVSPPCEHFDHCGGCAFQHWDRAPYLSWKRQHVEIALSRAGCEPDGVETVVATPIASRRRIAFAAARNGDAAAFGLHERRSRKIISLKECTILTPMLASLIDKAPTLLSFFTYTSCVVQATECENGLDIHLMGSSVQEPDAPAIMDIAEWMRSTNTIRLSVNRAPIVAFSAPVISFDGIHIKLPIGGFLQASKAAESALLKYVRDAVSGAKKIGDLFCGSGAFSLPLARDAAVSAFDVEESAIGALREGASNAQSRESLKGIKAVRRNLFETPLQPGELNEFDAIVLDPPRAGASAQAKALAKSRVKKVAYVSCDAGTFARDAAILQEGGFDLMRVTPVDQFVFSQHIELVGAFQRNRR